MTYFQAGSDTRQDFGPSRRLQKKKRITYYQSTEAFSCEIDAFFTNESQLLTIDHEITGVNFRGILILANLGQSPTILLHATAQVVWVMWPDQVMWLNHMTYIPDILATVCFWIYQQWEWSFWHRLPCGYRSRCLWKPRLSGPCSLWNSTWKSVPNEHKILVTKLYKNFNIKTLSGFSLVHPSI